MTAINHAVFVGTGARGVGKSTWAATYLPPSQVDKVFYIDSEQSANNIRSQIRSQGKDFGHYVDLSARFGHIKDDDLLSQITAGRLPWVDSASRSALVGLYEYILQELNDHLTQNKYRVVVIDTLEKMEAGMASWVESNKKAAGVTITAYGRMWTDSIYPLYESLIASIHARGVEVVILNSHLKTPWEGTRRIVGKVEPAGKPLLYKLSSLMLWFVNNRENADGAPAALVLKERLGKVTVGADDNWNISRQLPERLPRATWTDIRRYMDEGANLAQPADGERMTEAEREMISELLSDQQMRLMVLEAEKEVAEASILPSGHATFSLPTSEPVSGNGTDDVSMEVAAQRETVTRLVGAGRSKTDIASELGISLPQVIRLLKPE